MTQSARSEFRNALKGALDTYYIGWHVRHARNRPAYLPDADTLNGWLEGHHYPRLKTFTDFITRSKFPPEVRDNLFRLYQQLPRRTRSKKDDDDDIIENLEANPSDIVEARNTDSRLPMPFPPTISTIAIGADLAGYSKQDAILRDSQGNLTAFIRFKTGELAYIRKEKHDSAWSAPTVFDQTDDAQNFFHVAAAIDTADNIHVVWGLVPEASNTKYGLFDGERWVRQEIIATGTFAHNIAVDSANHPHVVWTNVDLSHLTYNGQRWLGPKSVARGFWHPDILIDRNDDVFLFVNNGGFRPQPNVAVYVIDNTQERWSTPLKISTSQFWSGAVAVTMNSQGDLYTAWIGTPTAEGGADQVFFSRRIDGRWEAPFPIGDVNWAASSTGQEAPAIAFDANDVLYVVWRGLNSKNRPMIFARALVPEGGRGGNVVRGWSQIIALDDLECSDVWWPSVTDGKVIHKGTGVDVIWRANKGRDSIINYAHLTYP